MNIIGFPKLFKSKYRAKGINGNTPISCCQPATNIPSDLNPPYFTIMVPMPHDKPADSVKNNPKILSITPIPIDNEKIPIIPKI